MPIDPQEPLHFEDLVAFDEAHAKAIVAAACAQERLRRTLDRLGEPGAARWDPHEGKLELRGRVFEAEALGSFDGSTWLWSWANAALALPEARMAIGQKMRTAATSFKLRLLATGEVHGDELLAYKLGDLAVAYGFADAYYLVNQSVVYLVKPGQLDEPTDRLGLLRSGLETALAGTQSVTFPGALVLAAHQAELTFASADGVYSISDPAEPGHGCIEVTHSGAVLEPIATCLAPEAGLADLIAPLLDDDDLAVLSWVEFDDGSVELTARGYAARLTPVVDAGGARACTIRVGFRQGYQGTRYVIHDPAQRVDAASSGATRGWVPTSVLELTGGRALSRPVPGEALLLCEQLEAGGHKVFDLGLGRPYAR